MARMTVNPQCHTVVRRVRRIIEGRMGADAATVFSEAIANVREHGDEERADLVLHRECFEVHNHARGVLHHCSNKPAGEGGYGVHIMERMGAECESTGHTTHVRWRKRAR